MRVASLRVGARVEVAMHGASEMLGLEGPLEDSYVVAYDDPYEALRDAETFLHDACDAVLTINREERT